MLASRSIFLSFIRTLRTRIIRPLHTMSNIFNTSRSVLLHSNLSPYSANPSNPVDFCSDSLDRPVRLLAKPRKSRPRQLPDYPLALITGASAGIGASTAILFAKAGCNLVLLARRAQNLADVKTKCEAVATNKGCKVVVVEADMTKRDHLDLVLGKLEGLKVDMWVDEFWRNGFGFERDADTKLAW